MAYLLARWPWLLAAGAACPTGACAPYIPPFTHASASASASAALAAAGRDQATLVFLWPYSGCEPGGYVTLVTADGRFLGNVGEGTLLRARVPAGDHTVLGWNELQEVDRGDVRSGPVPVLHANVEGGRTYYVRMVFGEWDDHGPFVSFKVGGRRACVVQDTVMTSAMVTLTPSSNDWSRLPDWTQTLTTLVPEREAGQAWLDADSRWLALHRAVAEARFQQLRGDARKMATVEVEDGVATVR